jgi:DNA polymerase-1
MIPTTTGKAEWIGHDEVIARLGIEPEKVPDYKGLRGDPSDNIPGVHGVGEKTALKLVKEFGSVEEIYKNIDKIEPLSLREKLANNAEEAVMSKSLATIIKDVPVTVNLDECCYHEFNKTHVKDVLQKYNFKSLIRRLGFTPEGDTLENKEIPDNQTALF